MKRNALFAILILFAACSTAQYERNKEFAELPDNSKGLAIATFAGGCFWCTEAVFERVEGVESVISGYSGGEKANPSYEEVSRGQTTHAESIQIYYDSEVVDFETLLDVFFLGAHDPTEVNRQGPDVGPQYRSVAFFRTDEEKNAIHQKIKEIEDSGKFADPIATQVVDFEVFYPAEKYHQNYYPYNQDNPYVRNVSKPKVQKFEKSFDQLLKTEYRKD